MPEQCKTIGIACAALVLCLLSLESDMRPLLAQSGVETRPQRDASARAPSVVGGQTASPDPDQTPEQATRPLRIVLLADNKDHGPAGNGFHDYPLWQEKWAGLLLGENTMHAERHESASPSPGEQSGAKVLLSTAWGWPSDQDFESADVIVSYCYLNWNERRVAQVRRYLEKGGGLVLIHSSTWTKPGPLGSIAQLTGVGGFELYRRGRVQLELVAKDHPICAGLPATIVLEDDETYWPPTPLAKEVTVLATSVEDKGAKGSSPRAAQPILWCYEPGKGRVFGCVPGHCLDTFDNPAFRLVLLRGIYWAAGRVPVH